MDAPTATTKESESRESVSTTENENSVTGATPVVSDGSAPMFSPAPPGEADARERMPDIKELTIKNLDTGEEFIIGKDDPDFEFDTFEIRGDGAVDKPAEDPTTPEDHAADAAEDGKAPQKEPSASKDAIKSPDNTSWWRTLFAFMYRSKTATKKDEEQGKLEKEIAASQKPKTPFTKLSSFKFKKELGRGAFGRVLLAEAKIDGKLYALKIISKKNMRSSDKRQAKAERDILHAMALKSPHPFTSGLKFAFQSENNLYLGMDFIPGGNLRELIKRFKHLPEVSTSRIVLCLVEKLEFGIFMLLSEYLFCEAPI
jgi:hypothetical protein